MQARTRRPHDNTFSLPAALRHLVFAALATALVPAQAQAQAQNESVEFTGTLALSHRKLVERTSAGATLLTERGPVAHVLLQAVRPLADGQALGLRAHLAGADLHYDGQTQAGVPLTTTTRQSEAGADLMWRPHAPAAWGEGWITFGVLANRRAIYGTPIAGGLDEVSSAALLGARWRSPAFAPVARWNAHVEAEGRVSVWHRLDVDFHGLLDKTHFEAARKRMLVVRVLASPVDSPWEWGVEWSGLWQARSKSVGVARAGVPLAGTTVHQPELTMRDVTLRVGRRF